VTTLRPGILTIFNATAREAVVVIGGIAEVSPAGLTVLADRATPREDFDTAVLAAEIKDAEEDVTDASDEAERDRRSRRLEQLRTLQAALAQ
jgi:F-type H+-transporting ATPase subunit epsilon